MARDRDLEIPPSLVDGTVITKYSGERSEDDGSYHSFHGEGHAEFLDGTAYRGYFFKGQMHGHGTLSWTDGSVYEGDFKFNKPDGEGRLTWPDGSTYVGEFAGGLRHGAGTFENPALGIRFEGEFKASKRHGFGRLTHGAKSWYEGEWKDGRRHGKGQMLFQTGETYDGSWADDLPDGFGTMWWPAKQERYIGFWKQGKRHGQGQHFWKHSETTPQTSEELKLPCWQLCNHYDGEWARGMRNGLGTFHYSDGARYRGNWVDDNKEGQGTFTYNDGRVYSGVFKADRMVGEEPEAEAAQNSAFGTIGVELGIDDLAPGMGPKGRRMRREVENVLLRWNADLRRTYMKCSQSLVAAPPAAPERTDSTAVAAAAGASTADLSGELFTIKLWQFWVFCRVCGIVDHNVSLAGVNRIVAHIRTVHGHAESEVHDMHNGNEALLFREFIEALVRIAFAKFASDLHDESLAALVSRLISDHVARFDDVPLDALRAEAEVALHVSPEVGAAYAACVREVDCQPSDRVASVRTVLCRLAHARIVGPTEHGPILELPEEPVRQDEPLATAADIDASTSDPEADQQAEAKAAAEAAAASEQPEPKKKKKGQAEAQAEPGAEGEQEEEPQVEEPPPARLAISSSDATAAILGALDATGAAVASVATAPELLDRDILACEFTLVTEALAAACVRADARLVAPDHEALAASALRRALVNPFVGTSP